MTKFCMTVDIQDVITCENFCDDRLRGLGVASGRISRFAIDLRRRPYNTLALPCECVITHSHGSARVLYLLITLCESVVKATTQVTTRSRDTAHAHCQFCL